MSEPRDVYTLGGASNLLEILADGPVRGLRNWPAAMALVHAGHAEARPIPEACDVGEERYYVYAITNRGRRKRVKFWGKFA